MLKVMVHRSRILGLDKPDESTAPAPRAVVITGDSEQYIGTIQSLIAETEDRR